MAVTALHSAASGLSSLSTQLDVVANNLANVNTTGFKRSRANFEDLLYQVLKIQGPDNADKLIHHIFRLGLDMWSDEFFNEAFGSQQNLEQFIEVVKKRNKGEGK